MAEPVSHRSGWVRIEGGQGSTPQLKLILMTQLGPWAIFPTSYVEYDFIFEDMLILVYSMLICFGANLIFLSKWPTC